MQDDNRMNRDGLISLAGGVPVYGGGDMLDRYMLSMCLYIVCIYIYVQPDHCMHEMAGESRGETKRGQHKVDADDAPRGRRHETDLLAQQDSETKNDPSINGRAA